MLQNRKKCARTNAGTKLHAQSELDNAIVAAVPMKRTKASTADRRNPGANTGCFIAFISIKR
jgi:hypothetical protein